MKTITIRQNIARGVTKEAAEEIAAGASNAKITSKRGAYSRNGFTTIYYVTADVEVEARIQLRGTCQLCGGDWAIKGDRTSKHGYKRPRWGFLVGECHGSHAIAAEKSTDRTQAAIDGSTEVIEDTIAKMAAIEVEARAANRWEDGSREYYLTRGPTDGDTSHERWVWKNAKKRAEFNGTEFNEPHPTPTMQERWNSLDGLRKNHESYIEFLTENVLPKLGDAYREELIKG